MSIINKNFESSINFFLNQKNLLENTNIKAQIISFDE